MFDQVAYIPGRYRAVVGQSTAMLFAAVDDLEEGVLARLWSSIRDATDLQDVVEVLIEIGIRRLPSLGLVHVAGDTANLLLRGDVSAVVHRPEAESERLDADGAVTWRELAVTGAAAIELETGGLATAARRPLLGGIVDAASLQVGEIPPVPEAVPAAPEAEPAPQALDGEQKAELPAATLARAGEAGGEPTGVPAEEDDEDDEVLAGEPPPEPVGGHTSVMAVRCPDGHANPPLMKACRVCGQPLEAADPVEMSRPKLGKLVFSDGTEVELDRPVVVGRAPKARRGTTAEQPQLVTVPSPEQEISRSHLEVRLDGWHVLVVDLGSTNGTVMTLPGAEPLLLRAGEEYRIRPGTEIALADQVSFVYQVTE